MTDQYAVMEPWTTEAEAPTSKLRFVERLGIGEHSWRILQQEWIIHVFVNDHLSTVRTEWRDVPMVREE